MSSTNQWFVLRFTWLSWAWKTTLADALYQKLIDKWNVNIWKCVWVFFNNMVIMSANNLRKYLKNFSDVIVRNLHIWKKWITTSCIMLSWVSIQDSTVIGVGSINTSYIPANCLATNNPCKVVKPFENF